jgi:hypothetical protein
MIITRERGVCKKLRSKHVPRVVLATYELPLPESSKQLEQLTGRTADTAETAAERLRGLGK